MNWISEVEKRILFWLTIPGIAFVLFLIVAGPPSWVITVVDVYKERWLNVYMLMVPSGIIFHYVVRTLDKMRK